MIFIVMPLFAGKYTENKLEKCHAEVTILPLRNDFFHCPTTFGHSSVADICPLENLKCGNSVRETAPFPDSLE